MLYAKNQVMFFDKDTSDFNSMFKEYTFADNMPMIRKDCIYFEEKEENKDKCSDCPFNDTSCPGGMWCTED